MVDYPMLNAFLIKSGLKVEPHELKFIFRWLFLALILHVIAAVMSTGFYHVDEHFQILEFMNYKLGRSPVHELPLEYGQLMRPWLLPALLTGITKFLLALGIQSPFDWALSYRLFASLLGWFSTAGLALCCLKWFPEFPKFSNKKWRHGAVMALTLLWYMPSLHARPSSENLAGSAFFMGLSFLLLGSPSLSPTRTPSRNSPESGPERVPASVAWISGILFGFAFEFRYQVAFMILGFLLWLLVVAKIPIRQIVPLLLGMLIPIGLGTWADQWGYGQWTCAPWNYLNYNIIQNHVSDTDQTQWWDYFRRAFTESWPILGFLTLVSFLIAWVRHPKHVLTWSLAPFFLAHEIIGHKEFRFLFPMAHAGGVLLMLSIWPTPHIKFLNFPKKANSLNNSNSLNKWVQGLVCLNLIALIITSSIPAGMPIRFYSYLYSHSSPRLEVYYKDDSLFNFGGAIMNFYRSPTLTLTHLTKYSDLMLKLDQTKQPLRLFSPHSTLPQEAGALPSQCNVEFSTLPEWLEHFRSLGFLNRVTNWTLFKCQMH